MTSRLWWMRLVFNKKAPKKNSALPNYRSHQNQETFAYQIENQRQCHRIVRPRHTIFHLTVSAVQHPF